MKFLLNTTIFILASFILWTGTTNAQCENWVGTALEDEASGHHSIYREALKKEDWGTAFEYWKLAYEIAPAADGKRDYHYMDGVKIYKNLFTTETDEAKKKEYVEKINELYALAIDCYESKSITLKCGEKDVDECYKKKIGYLNGRHASDMFYTLNAPYSENLAMIDKAFVNSGNDTEYIVFDPLARIVAYNFSKEKMTKEKALEYYKKMEDIAEYNIINNEKLGANYEQAWMAAKSQYRPIEKDIFDCDYFKPELEQEYRDDTSDPDNVKSVLVRLKRRGCPETDPLVQEIDAKWKTYAAEVNAQRKAEFEANNPAMMAKKMYDDGDFEGAVNKYEEAIRDESDSGKKASYMLGLASIKFRKLSQYAEARRLAKEAAGLKGNWGRPYMLIGDMYAKSARSCGDSWNQRLAIIAAMDKYNYAKSIDPSVATEASDRVGRYRSSLPAKDEAFMRGLKTGDSAKVGCWIGETVTVKTN